ncbi:MAG: hypothetical protein ACTH7Q_12160, partial [Pseudoalteromonas sp.]
KLVSDELGAIQTAQLYLLGRTMVEQFLLPVMDKFLSSTSLLDDKEFIRDLLKVLYPYVGAAYDMAYATSNWDRLKKFSELVYQDLTSDGYEAPLRNFLATRLGDKILQTLGTNVSQWIAVKFIPVVGQVDLVLEALQGVNMANTMGQTIGDFVTVPSKVEFEAVWPSSIISVTPNLLIKDQLPDVVSFTIEGYGLGYESCNVFNTCTFNKPQIELIDTEGDYTVDIVEDNILLNDTATEVTFTVPREQVDAFTAEIKLELEIADIVINAPENIKFIDKVTLTKLASEKAYSGEKVTVHGIGFIEGDTIITVASQTGRTKANIVSIDGETVDIIVPEDAVTGSLLAEVDGVKSNELTLTIPPSGISVLFGDNGNLLDDRFSVSVAGDSGISLDTVGQRAKQLSKLLSPGKYNIALTANEIPDERGTFYICFSDNIDIISGPSQSSKDQLTAVDQVLSWEVNVNEGEGKTISTCDYSTNTNNDVEVNILWNEL